MNKNRCYILCAGPVIGETPLPLPGDFVICCDGGLKTAEDLNIRFDLAVGDFDSYKGDPPKGDKIVKLPPEKDDTDSMAAIKIALDMGYRDFLLVCALGGRLDHTIGNLQALGYIMDKGGRATAQGCGERAYIVENGVINLRGNDGDCVSAFAFGGDAFGVSTSGMLYPLDNAVLSRSFPLGVSNRFTGDSGSFSVQNGRLLIILPRED